MDIKHINKIYDRLLSIKLVIESQSFPNPQYINDKISECHAYIDETERYSIQTTKEISVLQQALNNTLADYEAKKEDLLINDESIQSLPNIKDREAKANSLLKEESRQIKIYENNLNELNNLLKAISLKIRNLNRVSVDIRVMVRILESQVKLGMAPASDPVMKDFIEEMNKTETDTDTFQDVESEVIEEEIIDPTSDLDIDDLLETGSKDKEKKTAPREPTMAESEASLIEKGFIDPVPEVEPDITEDTPIIIEEDWPEIDMAQNIENESESKIIDLDSVIDLNQKGGGTLQIDVKSEISEKTDLTQKEDRQQKNETGIDIDDLLNNITIKK